jgi:hypothetical protein
LKLLQRIRRDDHHQKEMDDKDEKVDQRQRDKIFRPQFFDVHTASGKPSS